MKKNFLYVVLFVFVFILVGCTVEGPSEFKLISLDSGSIVLTEGQEIAFNATVEGVEGAVQWTSSNTAVAVYEDGKIKAIAEGECVITAAIADLSASVDVKVDAKVVETVKFTVKFYDDGYNLIKTEEVEQGKAATAPIMETTETKVFYKWDKEFSNVQSNLTVVAIYKTQYNVSYNLGGGMLDTKSIDSYFDGEGFDLPTAHKAGTKFLGWEESAKPGEYITSIEPGTSGDIALTAKYAEVAKMKVTFDYQNGISEKVYLASKTSACATYEINNYNTVFGAYWSNNYANYAYVTDKSNDPGATFSDRIYIGKDSETGLYKVISILLSGASSWPSGAQYVITYSSSYKNHYAYHQQTLNVSVGDYVVFDGDFTQMKTLKSVNVYYFNNDPTVQIVSSTLDTSKDKFETPSRLGFKFLGWKDSYGTTISSINELYEGAKLVAQWEERTPVTEIKTNDIKTEMITGDTFTIVAKVAPTDAYFQSVFYESDNEDIISVSSKGVLTAKNAGVANIKIYDFMKKVTLTKTINVYSIDSIDLNLGDFNGVLAIGQTLEIKPTAFGKEISGITFTYTSKTPTILEVSNNGVVKALANGVGKIEIKDSASKTHTLEIGVVVDPLVDTERVDQVLKLIAENNLATVQAGNACLYNDGTERYYKAMYSSVNYFLFQEYKVDNTNLNSTANPNGSPMTRRTTAGKDDTIQFVTVHDTATLTGNAASTAASMRTSGTSGSATIHYTTGQNKIYSSVDEKFIAYHAGDGTGNTMAWIKTNVKAPTTGDQTPTYSVNKKGDGTYTYVINGEDTGLAVPAMGNGKEPKLSHLGPIWKVVDGYYYIGKTWYCKDYATIGSYGGNNNSIGIEMGVNYNDDIYNTWQITAQLVADICVRNSLPLDNVKMHNTWTGKNCPQCLISGNYWYNFMKMVEVNYIIMKNYSDAKITMTTSDTAILSASGRIANPPKTTTTVSYTVTVEIGGVSKSMTFYNVVPGTTTWEQWNGSYPSSKIWNDGYFSKNDIINKPYNFY